MIVTWFTFLTRQYIKRSMHSLLIICVFYDFVLFSRSGFGLILTNCRYSFNPMSHQRLTQASKVCRVWISTVAHKQIFYIHTKSWIEYFKCQINAFWENKRSFSQSTLIKYTKCWFIFQAYSIFCKIFDNFLTRYSLVKNLCHNLFKIHLYHTTHTTNALTYYWHLSKKQNYNETFWSIYCTMQIS